MYESDDEQSKREFYYQESNNNKNNIKNDDFMSHYTYVRHVVYKNHKINLLLTSTFALRPR